MDIRGDTDVAGMRYELTPVSCEDGAALPDSDTIVIDRDLEDILIPGGIPELEGMPLDADSEHVFADAFVSLPAGCYDVVATPTRDDGEASEDCAPAFLRGVEVREGETTEVFLINQCGTESSGAIDAVATLNHAPTVMVYFEESKFGPRCEGRVVCAIGRDSDGDPLEFVWESTGRPLVSGPTVVSRTEEDGAVTECVEVVPGEAGRYDLEVTVYDQLHDEDGSLMRVEDWLAREGYPNDSHASLAFPLYAGGEGRGPETEICDGLDNDCDGEIDEDPSDVGAECTPEDGDPTGGSCMAGTTICVDGALVCDGYVGPGVEVCDMLDNDCDGEVDEDMVCEPGGECPDGTVRVCDAPIDLVLFEDLSGSFSDDLESVRTLAPMIFGAVRAAEPTATFGVASFIDKPEPPFGSAGDFVYRQDLPLTGDMMAFQTAIDGLSVGSGGDGPEAQLEGLQLLARNASTFGFRAGARRYVVLSTDANFHQEGDCTPAVCSMPNNGDDVADPDEDYPSVAQVAAALTDADITPIFAVTDTEIATYEALVADLGVPGAAVVELTDDSSNLVEVILAGVSDTCECVPE